MTSLRQFAPVENAKWRKCRWNMVLRQCASCASLYIDWQLVHWRRPFLRQFSGRTASLSGGFVIAEGWESQGAVQLPNERR
jgi:hypothetical protein